MGFNPDGCSDHFSFGESSTIIDTIVSVKYLIKMALAKISPKKLGFCVGLNTLDPIWGEINFDNI